MNLRRVLKEVLVQQISVSDGKVLLLFHPESPVKVETLLDLIKKQKNRFRLAPDGRLSFTPEQQEWDALFDEIIELLHAIHDRSPRDAAALAAAAAPA
jgi:transcription-repair coupling factor (superfamily II helicase)